MNLETRYITARSTPNGEILSLNVFTIVRDAVIALVIVILTIAFWPLRTVPTGSRGVVTIGGAIRGIEGEGFMLIAPWQRLDIFNIRAEEAPVEKADGATSDTQPVTVSLTVRYSIFPDRVAEVFEKYSHDGNLSSYVQTATQEVFKAITARYTAPELIAKRPQVSNEIYTALGVKLKLYGAQVINIDMRNFAFGESYMKAINEKVTQEQLRLAAENQLLTVQSQQKQKVAIAEAEASALKATADGQAYATLKSATAQAAATEALGNAIAKNPSVLELRRIEVQMAQAGRWNGAVPQNVYAGAPIPFLSVK